MAYFEQALAVKCLDPSKTEDVRKVSEVTGLVAEFAPLLSVSAPTLCNKRDILMI